MFPARSFALFTAFLFLAGALFAQDQVVRVTGVPAGTNPATEISLTVSYTTRSPTDETLTGLGLRLHWDSDELTFIGLSNLHLFGLTAEGDPQADTQDFDGDLATDTFLHVAWADADSDWTGVDTTPKSLFLATFLTASNFTGPAVLGLSASSTAAGYRLAPGLVFQDGFESGDTTAWSAVVDEPVLVASRATDPTSEQLFGPTNKLVDLVGELPSLEGVDVPILDIDGDDVTSPITDGLLVLRYLFGFRGAILTDAALGGGATRTSPTAIADYLETIEPALDIDLDGRLDALTDGLLVVRFLAGVTGAALTEGVMGAGAGRIDPTEVLDYLDALADPVGGGDTDGDGVSDLDEIVGYSILIDFDGLGVNDLRWNASLTERWVTSDPVVPDTDGDTLDDLRERLFRTDPRDPDTDSDGLGDATELNRYASAPASVDSDGDARGADGGGFPNPALFDGNELALYGTSPALADTDGDARTDFEEINQNATPPLVANVPKLAVELVGDLFIELDYTSTVTQSTRSETSTLVGQSDTSGQSSTDSTSSQWSIGASATVTAGVEAGFPGGATASAEASATVSSEYSEETTATFSEESSVTVQQENQESQETALEQSEEISGGSLASGLKIRNVGDVAFTLSDLAVTALLRDPDDRQRFQAVATLIPALPGGEITLGPFNGETGVLQVIDEEIGTNLATSLLADPAALYLEVGTFSLEDAEGRNFAFLAEVTNARTALLTIDFGNGNVERYRVATLVERNPDGTGVGVSLDEVLTDILEIPYETQPRQDSTNTDLFPNDVQLLTKVRDVETAIDADPTAYSNAFWAVLSNEPAITGETGIPFTTDFGDIVIQSGDTVSLTYVSDGDRDGLFLREEFLYRTLDSPRDFNGDDVIDPVEEARTLDFDEDGLTDFAEIRTGWQVQVGPNQRLVHPDPTRSDTDQFDRDGDGTGDGDGLSDLAEFRGRDGCGPHHPNDPAQPDPNCGPDGDSGDATDPTRADTDRDGLNDAEDNNPIDPFNTPPVISLVPTFANLTGILDLNGSVVDATDPIDRVNIDWGDGTSTCLANGPAGCESVDFDAISETHQYLQSGTFTVTVTATDRRDPPGVPASDSESYGPFTVNFPDDPEALYFFDNGSLIDGSGNGHTMEIRPTTTTYASVTLDRFGSADDAYCLRSDQLDECAEIRLDQNDHIPFDDQFTFAAWILRDRPNGMIVGQWDVGSSTAARLHFRESNGDVTFEIDDGTVSGSVSDSIDPPRQDAGEIGQCNASSTESDWRLFIGTVAYDGSDTTIRLYRGSGGGTSVELVEELELPGQRFRNPDPAGIAQIGGSINGPGEDCGNDFQGRIDDVRIYSRALSIPEMNALVNEVRNP